MASSNISKADGLKYAEQQRDQRDEKAINLERKPSRVKKANKKYTDSQSVEGISVIDVATDSVPMAASRARPAHLLTVVLNSIGYLYSPISPCSFLKKPHWPA